MILTLSIIVGKPGSGKTYHMAMLLVAMLVDWLRYELKYGESYDSSIWTNIVFNEEGLNATVSDRIGKEVDAWKYMNYCDDSFFNDPNKVYWWEKFPANAVIIIDEVHFHLGRKVDFGSLDLETELTNWISTHRHSRQEIYFLTQHNDQFASTVLGIADLLLEIVNLKSLVLPWPVNVPMSDFDELKRSFGITTQYYQSNVGNFRGKAIRWSGASDRHLMGTDIFRVYQSHDAGVEALDRPSLKMSPFEGVLWFARKHGWHLLPKFGVIVSLPFVAMFVLGSLPGFLMAAVSDKKPEVSVVQVEAKRAESKESRVGESVIDDRAQRLSGVVSSSDVRSVESVGGVVESGVGVSSGVGKSFGVFGVGGESTREVRVVMLYQKGVMLNDGRKITIGEAFDVDGKSETLSVACPQCGVIGFESGKRVQF